MLRQLSLAEPNRNGGHLDELIDRDELDRDLRAEMDFHIDMKAQKYRSQGIAECEARARAQKQFGNATQLQEKGRDAWGWTALEQFVQDLRESFSSHDDLVSLATILIFGGNSINNAKLTLRCRDDLDCSHIHNLPTGTASVINHVRKLG